MPKTKKLQKQVISVPTASKSLVKSKAVKTKSALTKPHSLRSKENTLAYYHCFIDQIANPLNAKKKITKIASHCRRKKGEIAVNQQEHKQQLLKIVAQSYLTFGENLGHLIQADVVGCAKKLKGK